MKTQIVQRIVGVILFGLVYIASAAPADVQAPKKREQIVEQAAQLAKTASPEAALPPENLRNPFIAAPVEEITARPTSDKDLLLVLAEQIQPLGAMGVPGNMMLTRKGQKPVKVNDKLTLSFDGASYEVEVTSIDNTTFSLRYNQTEITRPIKSGKTP
ncbi:MAG: hypothetical protein QM715_06815 [Nibricoccus sp.]